MVTPSLKGGSWRWIEEVLEATGAEQTTRVLAYGPRTPVKVGIDSLTVIPFASYERVGLWLSHHGAAAALYNLPLVLATQVVLALYRPDAVVANGAILAAACTPYAAIRRSSSVFLAYHGYSGGMPAWQRRALAPFLRRVARAFVNSRGTYDDLATLLPPEHIYKVEHWADEAFFSCPLTARSDLRSLSVLFVGRQDREKIGFLLEVIRACRGLPVRFQLVGDGPLAPEVHNLAGSNDVAVLGYISDKHRLAELYRTADVVWGVADDTYVAKPVVEALASGTPVIVPDVPAVEARARAGVRVPRDLLPADVAWIIDGTDVEAARDLLASLVERLPDRGWRCRQYAREHHSASNLAPVVAQVR